jgi:hypothetical protein
MTGGGCLKPVGCSEKNSIADSKGGITTISPFFLPRLLDYPVEQHDKAVEQRYKSDKDRINGGNDEVLVFNKRKYLVFITENKKPACGKEDDFKNEPDGAGRFS